jgi:PPOX class probable F420-dependent enzyme
MGVALPDAVREKLQEASFWHLATAGQNGAPTVSPVWVDVDGDHVTVNTAIGRLKERNARANPRVALSFTEPDNPYSRMEIRGRVVDYVEGEAADRSIDALAKKYLGVDSYPYRTPTEQRVMFRIEPTKVTHETG